MLTHSFFFNDTATTEIYTLSLHDALPISTPRPPLPVLSATSCSIQSASRATGVGGRSTSLSRPASTPSAIDRKSTRLNSSHGYISYAVFCLKKKKLHMLTDPQMTDPYVTN